MTRNRRDGDLLRVALTLEQLWHRVPGGTATSARDLTRALGDRATIDAVGVAAAHRSSPTSPTSGVDGVEVRHARLPRRALYAAWLTGRGPTVESIVGPVDVVHATGMVVPAADAPLVVSVHDLAFERYPDHPTRVGLRLFRRCVAQAKAKAGAIVCPSDATALDCLRHGFEPNRVHVVPWGNDWAVATEPERERARLALALPDRFVLWTGTVEPRKNLPVLLAAFARLPAAFDDVSLVLAGPQGWNESIEAAIAPLGGRVRRLGFVDQRYLPALYGLAEVFCYPSLWEGFGLPVLEAMSQATPVVTSRDTATAEVVGDAGALIDPTDDAALAEVLAGLLADRTQANALGVRGAARAARLSWSDTAAAMERVYRSVLA